MLQDNANVIKQIMQKENINFTSYEENIIETTREEIDIIMQNMTERHSMLKGVDLSDIKHMSWSKYNEIQCKENIESWDTHDIQEYDIIINNKEQVIDINAKKYAKLKAIMKLPLDCEFWVIENNKNDSNTYTIMSNASNDACITNKLDALNIPFMKGNRYTINEDNINKIIWNMLNNASIDHTYKQHKLQLDRKHLYIRAIHTFESRNEISSKEEKENFYDNCRNMEIFLENINHNKDNCTCEATIIGRMKDVKVYMDAYNAYDNVTITRCHHQY